ncbi:MAG TPA: hypothetical protein VM492_14940, partial [Sumerlaeia bacterium]|nr:hypothetical protein [Sumerlaeia bacterium]
LVSTWHRTAKGAEGRCDSHAMAAHSVLDLSAGIGRIRALAAGTECDMRMVMKWRSMGKGRFPSTPLEHGGRGVYSIAIPAKAIGGEDFEYCVRAQPKSGKDPIFPATAAEMNQTVVVTAQAFP